MLGPRLDPAVSAAATRVRGPRAGADVPARLRGARIRFSAGTDLRSGFGEHSLISVIQCVCVCVSPCALLRLPPSGILCVCTYCWIINLCPTTSSSLLRQP